MKNILQLFISILLLNSFLYSQTNNFDVENYKDFLSRNKNMSPANLQKMYPMGSYKSSYSSQPALSKYYDSVSIKYALTDYEKSLIEKHGFMVSERLSYESFGKAILDIYNKDLPIFVSVDAIAHAFHLSYDRILMEMEVGVIIDKLKDLLIKLKNKTPELDTKYAAIPGMKNSLRDYDVYVTMPLLLLGANVVPFYPENGPVISDLIGLINANQFAEYSIFGNSVRKIDFSQFKPRGHYTSKEFPELAGYFKAMIWLGKIEIYLIPPHADDQTSIEDTRRQSADAMLVQEAAVSADLYPAFSEIESLIGFFVGEQDNVTLVNLKELKTDAGIADASKLLDSLTYIKFADTLKNKSYAYQKILSQVLMHDPMMTDSIIPAAAFLLFGQRFVIDSYITGNVVYDRITKKRMLPSLCDVLFSVGNNAAEKFLESDLEKFGYALNLAGLRYLIDSYGSDFWNSTLYNQWLNSIKQLNPPENKADLPEFMQTAAYWQQKMNSQLASWTELRHDNLLYAKQSYSGGVTCSYPYSYVEPIPAFYNTMKVMATSAYQKFQTFTFTESSYKKDIIVNYFKYFANVADTLEGISQKELANTPLSEVEKLFLAKMYSENRVGCAPPYSGWYFSLIYNKENFQDGFLKKDYLVADMHTSPTDEFGNMVGWVKHCGTGPVNMGVWIAQLPGEEKMAFTGPVMSYYEYTTTNFLRLTDEDWLNTYQIKSPRPDYTNLYLAGNNGLSRGDGPTLTGVNNDPWKPIVTPKVYLTINNYPNPFNPSTKICYTIPYELNNEKAELAVYNIAGELIKTLVSEVLPSGTYYTNWEGKNSAGKNVASGVYIYRLKVADFQATGKMNLIK